MEPDIISPTENMSKVMNEFQKGVECTLKSIGDHKDIVEVFEALSNMKSSKEEADQGDEGPVVDDPSVGCTEEGLAGRISLVERGKECDDGKLMNADSEKVEVEPRIAEEEVVSAETRSGSEVGARDKDASVPQSSEEKAAVPDDLCKEVESPKGELASSDVQVESEGNAEEVESRRDAGVEGKSDDFKGKKRKVDEIEERGKAESEEEESEVEGGERRREERWRKRRKRKSRRKPSNASSSSILSSADEREPRRGGPDDGEEERRRSEQERGVEDEQQFCLRWNNFLTNITSQFGTLRDDEDFVDVTLACGGMQVKAHRVVLSACSPYFKRMFKSVPYCQHPVVFLEGIQPSHLLSLLAFMYCGEVGVRRGQLPSLLSTAHALQIRGLTEMGSSTNSGDDEDNVILSAKKQASAVERALKDIGLCDSEKVDVADGHRISGLQSSSPAKSMTKREMGRVSPVITRHRRCEMQKQATLGDNKENPVANLVNRTRDQRKEDEPSGGMQERAPSSSQSPNTVRSVPMDVPSLRATRKNHQSPFVVKDSPAVEELTSRVNSQSPVSESTVLCDMAANLVDVRMGSPLQEERHGGIICVDGAVVLPPVTSQSPRLRERDNLSRHGWDPGEEQSSHFEPRIDLVTGADFGLIRPKEEMAPYNEVQVEEVSLSHVVEPKTEYHDLSSAEGETSRSCGVPMTTEQPPLSLPPNQQHKYRPHVLGTPIITAGMQARMPASTSSSSSSSQLYAHFLPPMSSTSIPAHLSPGSAQLAEGMRGHLKWEMPRPCPVCRRIYSNNSNLRRHLRTIHEEYYEKYVQ